MTDEVPKLRSLSPTYVADQHEDYVRILKSELTKTGTQAPRNVALTGHYGSGKSSVLAEAQRQLDAADLKVINLSLPSLGIGSGRIPKDGDPALDKTNLIQKEIVKQLLYRRKPSDTPASRYNRLDTFHWYPALWRAAVVGVAVTGFALLVKLPNKVRDSLPPYSWSWLNEHLWGKPADWLQWLSLLVVFVLSVMAMVWAQRLLQQRFRVTELAAGPTKVTLSESSSSYFDEYLDEIVYFFQTSKTAVVIFEDLDRFEDPHIFETLRELNMLLNNAEQTGSAPIRFVYAIRDSVFEQLDVDAESVDSRGADSGSPADQGETRRLMSTNRTKFFDLVVPMVPFISHRTSRDLIRQQLDAIDSTRRPGNAVIDIVGVHLTDMRLIKNICNEYEVFCRRILTEGGLKELTADRLFASIVYKNLYLADYEKIRDGTSRLDTLYGAYREWVSHQTAAARTAERLARTRLRRIDAITSRSTQLGARLQSVLIARHLPEVNANNVTVSAAGTTYQWVDLKSAEFWRAYLQNRGRLDVVYRPGYGSENLPFDKVQALMGQALSPEDWADEARTEATSAIAEAVAERRTVTHASMTDALGERDKVFPHKGDELSVAGIAERLFDGADLTLELLRAGFIDENFTLYITQFPGQAISASAMNFIIKSVQPDVMDIEYHFGTGEDADTGDIDAVLEAEGPRLLGGQSVYNIQVFDHLLTSDPSKLHEPIRRLAANAANESEFLDAYLTSGRQAASLIRLLSASWAGIFDYLIGPDTVARPQDLLDAALGGVQSDLTYLVNAGQRDTMTAALPNLATVTEPQGAKRSEAIARTMEQMGIHVDELADVAEPLRSEVVARNLYPPSLTNLRTILGGDDRLPLDAVKGARKADVYPHVLAHLRGYLSALDEAQSVPTVADSVQFAGILTDVGEANPDALEEVANRANPECMIDDLDGLDARLWPPIASAHRLALTAKNVAVYIAEHGIEEPIAGWLTAAGVIDVDDDATPLAPLALKLLNAEALTGDSKLSIVESLDLDAGAIPAASLETAVHPLLPTLVRKGLVEDDAEAFTCLGNDEWTTKEALISASKGFPSYMTSLSLSTNELLGIASRPVPDAVKDAMLDELDTFEDKLGPKGAAALAAWAASSGRTPTPHAIVTLATKGGASSARPILNLLGAQASMMDLESMKSALNALEGPYRQLTTPGRDRPKLPISEGVGLVLSRLRSEGIVSKYEVNTKKSRFEVSKRHS